MSTVYFNAKIIEEAISIPTISIAIRALETETPEIDDIVIQMPIVSLHHFQTEGSVAASTRFSLSLDNPGAYNVRVIFSGMSSPGNNAVLGTTNRKIGIELRDNAGCPMALGEAREYSLMPGENTLDFVCSLISTGTDVLPGEVAAIAVAELSYA